MPRQKFWVNNTEAVLVIMSILIIIGTINVFSASFVLAGTQFHNPYYFLTRHLISLAVGITALIFTIKVDYRRWRGGVPLLFAFTLIALVLVLVIGVEVNGSKRWLNIVVMQFQPSELAKLVSILMAAAYLGPRIDKKLEIRVFTTPMFMLFLLSALIELQPDLGTAALVFGIPLILHVLAGLEWKWLGILTVPVVLIIIGLTILQPYRLERIKAWIDPWPYQQNQGYQTVQSMSAIGSGGFFGVGLGEGTGKYSYLPEAHTDFAFAIFCQENGYIGAIFLFSLLALLAFYGGKIANQVQDGFGKMLVSGVLILIVGQSVANIAMVSGILPVVGVPLPFISYGGTSLIINMVGIGLLVNVGQYAAKHPKQATTEESVPIRTRLRLVKK